MALAVALEVKFQAGDIGVEDRTRRFDVALVEPDAALLLPLEDLSFDVEVDEVVRLGGVSATLKSTTLAVGRIAVAVSVFVLSRVGTSKKQERGEVRGKKRTT